MSPWRLTSLPEPSPGWGPLATVFTFPPRTICSSLLAPESPTSTPYFFETDSCSGATTFVVSVLTWSGYPSLAAAVRVEVPPADPAAGGAGAPGGPPAGAPGRAGRGGQGT